MKHINNYNKFNIFESSKNDPIPEITKFNRNIGIVLMGAPGVGKSFFIENYILNKNRNIKVFSTDDVSITLNKDPNLYHPGSSELNMKRLRTYVKSGGSFIFDTTGTHRESVVEIVELSKGSNYDLIFIHIMGTLDMSLRQNSQRSRNVDVDYIRQSYDTQSKNIKFYSELNPDKYYIVYNMDGKYRFLQYEDGKLLKRKVDKYVPFKESVEYNDFGDNIKNHLIDLVDLGIEFKLRGIGDSEAVSSNSKNVYIRQSIDIGRVRRNEFSIIIPGSFTFEQFNSIMDIMFTLHTYISNDGWKLHAFNKNSKFSDLKFSYLKDDGEINEEMNEKQITNLVEVYFKSIPLTLNGVEFDDNDMIRISYDNHYAHFSGEFEVSNNRLHEIANDLVRILGASDYDISNYKGDDVIEIFL